MRATEHEKTPIFSLQLEHRIIHIFTFCLNTILGTSSYFIQNHYIVPRMFAWDENSLVREGSKSKARVIVLQTAKY